MKEYCLECEKSLLFVILAFKSKKFPARASHTFKALKCDVKEYCLECVESLHFLILAFESKKFPDRMSHTFKTLRFKQLATLNIF